MFNFGPNILDAALGLVHASTAAYLADPKVYPAWSMLGMDRVETFPMVEFTADEHLGSTNGFVASNADHLIISFRGSDDVFDLAVNLATAQNPDLEYYEGAVHRGFAEALDDVWMELRTLIDTLHLDGQRIWVTGHSLGGALATLTAKRLHAFMEPVQCITFGQPRVGDPQFYGNYKVKHHRFVNEQDLVPKLPPRGIFTRYWHIGTEEFLDQAGNHDSGQGDTSLLEDLFFGRLANSFNLTTPESESFLDDLIQRGMNDHRILTYVQRIEELHSARR